MSQTDWFVFLHDEWKKASKDHAQWTELLAPGDRADGFAELNFSTEQRLHAAIWKFSEEGTWPELSQAEWAMLIARLDAAVEFVQGLMFLAGSLGLEWQKGDWSRPEWIRWFLLDCWEHVGFAQVHGNLEFLRRVGGPETPPLVSDIDGEQAGSM